MSGLDNLCLMAGPAKEVLSKHVANEQISAAFVNFPEPPQQAHIIEILYLSIHILPAIPLILLYFLVIYTLPQIGDGYTSEGAHMLNVDFFREIHRVLQPGVSI